MEVEKWPNRREPKMRVTDGDESLMHQPSRSPGLMNRLERERKKERTRVRDTERTRTTLI